MAASGSDYLGRCVPEACVVRGFERIHYAVLLWKATPQDSAPTQDAPPEKLLNDQWQRLSRLRRMRRLLIQKGALAEFLQETSEIWVFAQNGEPLDAALSLADGQLVDPAFEGCYLAEKGTTDTNELLNCADSTSTIPLPNNIQQYKHHQQGHSTLTGQKLDEKANKIYHTFIKAAESTLAYHLCEGRGYLPMPSGSLLQPPELDEDDFLTLPGSKDARVLTLSATLTRHGSLVLTWSCWNCSDLRYPDRLYPLQPIKVFPFGGLCYVPATTAKATFSGSAQAAWRSLVIEYLKDDGILLEDDDVDLAWMPLQATTDSDTFLEWPEMLCYQDTGDATSAGDETAILNSFGTNADPLELALQLLWTRTEDKGKDGPRSLPQSGSDDQAEEIDFGLGSGLQPFSPASIRQGPLQDFGLSGTTVYPTPPDGLQAGSMADLVAGDVNAFVQPENIPLPEDASTRARSASFLQHDGDISMRGASLDLSNDDDLFGDEQDQITDQPGITDADFDFFSKELPDDADITMGTDLDISSHANSNASPMALLSQSETVPHQPVQSQAGAQESLYALSQADGSNQEAPVAVGISNQESGDAPPSLSINTSRPTLARKTSTFSPICDQEAGETPMSQSRQFNPVKFHQEISQSDLKYSSGGRFFKSGQPLTPRTPSVSKDPSVPQPSKTHPYANGSHAHEALRPIASSDESDSSDSEASDSDESFLSRSRHRKADEKANFAIPLLPTMQQGQDVAATVDVGDVDMDMGESLPEDPDSAPTASQEDQQTIAGIVLNAFQSSVTQRATRMRGSRSGSLPGSVAGSQTASQSRSSTIPPEQMMELAQILFDQLAFSSTQRWTGSHETSNVVADVDRKHSGTRQVLDAVEQVFDQASPVDDIDAFAIVDPTPILSSPRLQSQGSSRPTTGQQETIFDIPPPSVEVSRNNTKWSLTSTSIAFWDTLGLGPANGPKDCIAHCVVASNAVIKHAAADFVHSMQIAYQSARFGKQQVGGLLEENESGIVELKAVSGSHASFDLSQINEECRKLGHMLKKASTSSKAHVVYFADFLSPSPSKVALQAALALEKAFDVTDAEHDPRLFVKVVPWDMVASTGSIVILEPATTLALSHEIYDRISTRRLPKDTNRLPIFTAPSIELEEPAVTKVPLQLTEASAVDPLMEGSCLHIAYARSADQKWITTVWTDSGGRCQTKAAYSLQGHSFPEIAIEIWATTLEMIRYRKLRWRLILVALEGTRKNEITAWLRFAERSRAWLSLTLMTCYTDASLDALPPPTPIDSFLTAGTTAGVAAYTTPISTPKPVSSPIGTSPAGNSISTPMSDAAAVALPPDTDPSARLVDLTDQAWGIVLSHRLNVCSNQPVFIPSLVSGFLAKRTGPSDYDSPTMLEVSLIYCAEEIGPGESAMARDDKALREVLSMYRGLAMLARLRGMQDEKAVLPLHILAAKRGAEALTMLSSA